jgi:hypothetical protein
VPAWHAPARWSPIALVAIVAALLVLAASAQAQTYAVTNLGDSGVAGDGSLRGEIKAANAAPGADTIEFASGLSGLITINGTGLVIEDPVDIEGPGPDGITIEQIASNHRVLQIKMGVSGAVTLAGLTIRGGNTEGSGGDIENVFGQGAALTVSDCHVIDGHAAELGGGIDSIGEPLVVRESLIEGNEAVNGGGGIWAGATAPLRIEGSTIAGNFSIGSGGGGVWGGSEAGSSAVIEGSTFVGNEGVAAGGAINWSTPAGTSLTIANSTFVGNTTGTWGGAIAYSSVGAVTIEGSTITGNLAEAPFEGAGGLEDFGPNPTLLVDTIVAGNKSLHTMQPDLKGSWNSAFDLIGDPTGAPLAESVPGSNLIGVDPQLGPLAANGGPTETMALPPTSPAVNKGGGSLTTDQRGDPRPSIFPGVALSAAPGANGADIGAYELQAPPIPGAPSSGSSSPPGGNQPPSPRKKVARPPRVRVSCPKRAAPSGCHFALQVFSAKPHLGKGKGKPARRAKSVAESLVAVANLRPGKSAEPTLTPKPKFAVKLDAAKSLLVREAATIGGRRTVSYRRVKVVG